MKKAIVVLSVLVFGSIEGFSQYYTIDNDEYELYNDETRKIIKNSSPNEEVNVVKTNNKGKVYRVVNYKFNQDKKMISWVENGKSDKEKYKRLLNYEGKNLKSKEIHKRGRLKFKTENTFDGNYIISFTKFNSKNDILYKRIKAYTKKEFKIISPVKGSTSFYMKKIKSTITYKKGGIKQAKRWAYEYDGDGERTKRTLYNKKDEVQHVWDYTCKNEGELVQTKNETQQCKWEEIEDGMLVKVTRTTSPKGKISKFIQKYDADTNIVEQATYVDDLLTTKGRYDKSFFKPLTWEWYRKGKLKTIHKYDYNKNGETIGYKTYWGRDKASPKREVKYTYENDRLVVVNTFSKGDVRTTFKISYN